MTRLPCFLGAFLVVTVVTPAGAARHPELVSVESALCTECHDDKMGAPMVHAPAGEDCTTCHEVSITEEGTTVDLLDAEPALCLVCHDDKEPAAEFELDTPHMPVGDSCLACHDPHSGSEPAVLRGPLVELCGACHELADLEAAHGGQLTPVSNCATCHAPHGSNNVSMLTASKLHAPFEGGSCDACHRAPFGERMRLRARGERLCVACHGELAVGAEEAGSVHAALRGQGGRAGCLSCHDPHMSDNAALLKEQGPKLCSACHDAVVEAAGAPTGHPPAADDCLSCHRPHVSDQPGLLAESRDLLCAVCHDLEPPAKPASTDAIEIAGAGRESLGARRVVAAADYDNGTSEPSLCASPFPPGTWDGQIVVCERGAVRRVLKSEHVRAGGAGGLILVNRAGAADDVFADPHRIPAVHIDSSEAAQLASWLREAGDHQARIERGRLLLSALAPPAPLEVNLVTAHLSADLAALDCTSCHSPHGAGHPKLLADHLHAPVEDGCDTCHEGRFDELMEGGGSELCLLCHDGIGEAAADAAVPHAALELADCTDCHNPHAAAQEKLVKAPGAGPCAECHEEQMPGEGESAHGVIDLVGCRACHEAHGGENENLLRQTGPELCLSCHAAGAVEIAAEARRVTLAGRFEVSAAAASRVRPILVSPDGQRNHPVTGHRTLGEATEEEIRAARVQTTFTGALNCLVCHDPHKGRSSKLFRWNAATVAEACGACHVK